MSVESVGALHLNRNDLETFITSAYLAVGMPCEHAIQTASIMADADLHGYDAHGVFRLNNYIKRIQAGGVNLNPQFRVVREHPSTALVDGDNGQGHLVVSFASQIAIRKASQNGIGWVGIRQSNHAGPGALYSRLPLAHDMIGLYAAVANVNRMAPWGGAEALLGTNPLSIAVPSYSSPDVILDMATTASSHGKLKLAAQRKEKHLDGWLENKQESAVKDSKDAHYRNLPPIGDYKGYGLSLMLGFLAGTLNGASLGRDVFDYNVERGKSTNTGQFIAAINIASFTDIGGFKNHVDDMVRQIKTSPTLPGIEEVRLPGERTFKTRLEREKDGIPIHPNLLSELNDLAEKLGIEQLAA